MGYGRLFWFYFLLWGLVLSWGVLCVLVCALGFAMVVLFCL